jgi:hypothetical protein
MKGAQTFFYNYIVYMIKIKKLFRIHESTPDFESLVLSEYKNKYKYTTISLF